MANPYKKILLVRNDNIGDLICTTPAIEALRKKLPETQIDIVVNSYNYDAINRNPHVDCIYCYTKPKHRKKWFEKVAAAWGKAKILWKIHREKYDAVVVFRSGYSKSAELFSNVSGAPIRIGVKDPKGKDRFTHHVEQLPKRHEVEFCFDCLKPFDVTYDGEKTDYFVENSLIEKYRNYHEYVLFHISSRVKENRYPKEKYKEVFDSLTDFPLLITCEPNDVQIAKWLEQHSHAKYLHTESFHELSGLIANVKLFVTLDGGAMHLGPAVGAKTICISGKTDMDKWHPWGYKDLVIQSSSKRAEDISPKQIVEKIKKNCIRC